MPRSIHALAGRTIPEKLHGLVLQREAFRHDDLLPIYGTSELVRRIPLMAPEFFRDYPTGFRPFAIGDRGEPLLLIVEQLAASGPAVRGRKVAISLSEQLVDLPQDSGFHARYAGNFSPLLGWTLVRSRVLPTDLKQAIARRMLTVSTTLDRDLLLTDHLRRLAHPTAFNRTLDLLFAPGEWFQARLLSAEDEFKVLKYLWHQRDDLPPPDKRPQTLAWDSLLPRARALAIARAGDNPFGMDSVWYNRFARYLHNRRGTLDDEGFRLQLEQGPGWGDLQLLLRTLAALEARPLLLSMPLNGTFMEYRGTSAQARALYYRKLARAVEGHPVTFADFSAYEGDKYVFHDQADHLSPYGWLLYDRTINAFYHDSLR